MAEECLSVNCEVQTLGPALVNADLESAFGFIHSEETLPILKGKWLLYFCMEILNAYK